MHENIKKITKAMQLLKKVINSMNILFNNKWYENIEINKE